MQASARFSSPVAHRRGRRCHADVVLWPSRGHGIAGDLASIYGSRQMKAIVAGVLLGFLGACSHSQVSPAAGLDTKEMCIVENARVHSDFLRAYQQGLRDK